MAIQKFELPKEYRCHVEAQSEAAGARYEVRTFRWGDLREVTYSPPCSYLEVTNIRALGRYVVPSSGDPLSQGSVRFFPAAHTFHSRWQANEQHSFFCGIDIAGITGVELELSPAQLRATISVESDFVRMLLARARAEVLEPGPCSQLVLDSISVALGAELIQYFAARPVRRERGKKLGQQYLHDLAVRIREEPVKPTLADLADEVGVSTRHYARLFRDTAGEGLASFCNRQVFLLAQDLLNDRTLLIKQIAFRCGFADTAAFSKAFRRAVGVSPQQYRQAFSH